MINLTVHFLFGGPKCFRLDEEGNVLSYKDSGARDWVKYPSKMKICGCVQPTHEAICRYRIENSKEFKKDYIPIAVDEEGVDLLHGMIESVEFEG